ncbi:hypothetical protein LZ318_30900 [Saccharopolyspora indica]|uniref:hypothetical protein n=1 Tax=Saccharopolyspora indica TaxID=1229659 RepID=UPI0022EAEDEF|nr:hypothetical protein [Saccharopolyspora indica]MDA3644358.1 hypothetical protein [Saccharopolyspora indica]
MIALPVAPGEPLSQHADRARARLAAAAEECCRIQLIHISRIITAALHDAASGTIDVAWDAFMGEKSLEAIYAADGTLLWHADNTLPEALDRFRYRNGKTWSDAVEVINGHLDAAAIALGNPDALEDRCPEGWVLLRATGGVAFFRIALPDQATVDHHISTPPADRELEIVIDRDPDHGSEATAFLDGVECPAVVTAVDPGRGWTRENWQSAATDSAATASPAAAALIHQLFADGEDSPYVFNT